MTMYEPRMPGVKALLDAGTLNYRSPKMLEILDLLAMYPKATFTQGRLRTNVNVSMPTCSKSVGALLKKNLIREVMDDSGQCYRPKQFMTNIDNHGNILPEQSLKDKLSSWES